MDKVIVVIGATGTGKSQLAIDLGLRLKSLKLEAEIISADSMQIYNALPILTNQVQDNEKQNIPHHLIGFVEPTEQDFNVQIFSQQAIELINNLSLQQKIPIIVGGTHYYVESLLWKHYLIENENATNNEHELNENNNNSTITEDDTDTTYHKLLEVDPLMAEKIHPNEKRKIKRSLEIFKETGKRHSDIIQEKQNLKELRYDPCVFWVSCDQEQLNTRLETRIQSMIQKGLLDELRHFFNKYTPQDFTRGIFQAIGCKEFFEFVKETPDSSNKDLQECIDKFVQNTKRYSKVQLNWIRKLSAVLNIHKLDTTDVTKWHDHVLEPAWHIVQEFLEQSNPIAHPAKTNQAPSTWKRNICTLCNDRVFVNEIQWLDHLKSKGHKANQRKQKKAQMQQQLRNNEDTLNNETFIEIKKKDT